MRREKQIEERPEKGAIGMHLFSSLFCEGSSAKRCKANRHFYILSPVMHFNSEGMYSVFF